MHVIAGDKSSDPLAELDPSPDDYYIVKYRWSSFHQTYLDLGVCPGKSRCVSRKSV
jgi:isochorismate hydrolase